MVDIPTLYYPDPVSANGNTFSLAFVICASLVIG